LAAHIRFPDDLTPGAEPLFGTATDDEGQLDVQQRLRARRPDVLWLLALRGIRLMNQLYVYWDTPWLDK
jgi:hypothetical protein